MAQIICRDLAIGYEGKTVVQNINLSVKKGDYLCVIGENGAGKSTFMKTLLGLLPPVSGKIEFYDGLKKNEIGYLPQQTQAQKHFPASVMEVVLSGFQNQMHGKPWYRRTQKKEALRNLERLEITDLKGKCYGELSGGQQQRVLLARALCATERLLVLDEPVTGLDMAAAASLYANLDKLHQEGVAIIMVTHDVHKAVECADYILHIREGDYFYGNVAKYLETEYAGVWHTMR